MQSSALLFNSLSELNIKNINFFWTLTKVTRPLSIFCILFHNSTEIDPQTGASLKLKTKMLSCSNYVTNKRSVKLNLKAEPKSLKEEKQYLSKKSLLVDTQNKINNDNSELSNPRISRMNIQMLSDSLHRQIFRSNLNECSMNGPTEEDIKRSILHLQQNGLWDKEPSISPDVSFTLPPLKGKNLEEHFHELAEAQSGPYKTLLNTLIASRPPAPPFKFDFSKGWTKYYATGKMEKVDYPQCSSLVFDIEVCMSEGKHPTLACAVSDKYWYSWCADSLIDPKSVVPKLDDLIPLGSNNFFVRNNPKLIIGHNVSFDRLAVKEQYYLEDKDVRFLDTMSLHIAVSGLVEDQRNMLLKNKNAEKKIKLPWMNVGCTNSLKDVYKFYCRKELQKESRNVFVKDSIKEVREKFQELMRYCAQDVVATRSVLVKLFPKFSERFPHPVTLAGMLEMGTAYLPVGNGWNTYTSLCEEKFNEFNATLTSQLSQQALEALELQENKKYKSDIWLWDLDWNLPKGRVKMLQNYPNWYRKLCMKNKTQETIDKPQNMSTSLKIVPKLLKLTWKGYPLHYDRNEGWGYLKPIETQSSSELSSSDNTDGNESLFPFESLLKISKSLKENEGNDSEELPGVHIGISNVIFYPLPHKNGEGNKVGNPLSKDFLTKLEDNTLSSAVSHIAKLVLKTTKTISYWKNNRDRILSQIVMHLDHKHLPSVVTESADYNKDEEYGAILPQVVTAGTITRRAVERTWMTASNAYSDRIGSELKAMIRAPPGYHFVGADVDSQELWIASVLGDAYHSDQHGSTALGWMTLQGNKAEGTDMHSRTAETAGISRNDAKVINYGRIYGAGLQFIQRLLKQFNPSLSNDETKQRATKLFASTKGEKGWYLNSEGINLAARVSFEYNGQALSRREINRLLRLGRINDHHFSRKEILKENSPVWIGGSESHMFNCLEAIARLDKPRTPVLGARITRALEPWCVDDQFMTSRVNWVVQSSAVDFLHLMLVSMRWIFSKYKINGRFSISIHDEVRYLVASEDRYRAALALQITNLLTRSFISMRLGLNDLPQSVAFFSSVDVDKVLRKEPDMDCVTPSNPKGLLRGYEVPKGEAINIYRVLEKTGGKLTSGKNTRGLETALKK